MEILVDYDPRYASIEHVSSEKMPLYEKAANDTRMVDIQQIGAEGDVLLLQSRRLGRGAVAKTAEIAALSVDDDHIALQIASFNGSAREEFYKKLAELKASV